MESYKFQFDSVRDVGLKHDGLNVTWVNINAPRIGSMRILHDASCDEDEAVRRTQALVDAYGESVVQWARAEGLQRLLDETLPAETERADEALALADRVLNDKYAVQRELREVRDELQAVRADAARTAEIVQHGRDRAVRIIGSVRAQADQKIQEQAAEVERLRNVLEEILCELGSVNQARLDRTSRRAMDGAFVIGRQALEEEQD